MNKEELVVGRVYETIFQRKKLRPFHLHSIVELGVVGINLDTGREVFLTNKDIQHHIRGVIEDYRKWMVEKGL